MIRKDKLKPVLGVFLYFLAIVTTQVYISDQAVNAANVNLEPDGDGTITSWNSTGANYYTEIDDGVLNPNTPNTSDYIDGNSDNGGTAFFRMETQATDIYMVTRIRIRIYHNDGSNGRIEVQLFDDDESSTLTSEKVLSRNNSVDGWDLVNFPNLQILPSQLDSLSVRLRLRNHGGGSGNTVTVHAMYAQTTYDRVPRFRQAAYRFFANSNSTDVGSPLGAQDANITLASAGDAFRLRLLLDVQRATIPQDMEAFTLQFVDPGTGTCPSPSGGTPASYTEVTGSTVIAFNDNASPADEDALTPNANDPTHDSDTTINQSYQEANDFSNSEAIIPKNDSAMWDFSLIDNSAPSDTSYCFRVVFDDDSTIWAYNEYPQVSTTGGVLTVDIVDAGGTPVANPSRNMADVSFSFDCETTTGQLGVGQQRVRVDNGTATPTWSLTIAATSGNTETWQVASNEYDFNDPAGTPAGCADGGDSDSLAGQLSWDLGSVNITPQGGCNSTGISAGSDAGFNEGTLDSVTLATASSSADTGCYWDFRNMDINQTIPAEQRYDQNYNINLTVTVTAT